MEEIVKVVWMEGDEVRSIKGKVISENENEIEILMLNGRIIKISKKAWIKTEEIDNI